MKKIKLFIPWLAIIVSTLSAYYAYTGVQVAKESNKIAQDIQDSNTKLYLAEKRPYIDVEVSILEGKYLTIINGENPEGKFSLKLQNLGGLTARDAKVDIYYYDNDLRQYNHTSIIMPPLQRIFPGKFQFVDLSFKDDKDTTDFGESLRAGKLLIQVEIRYKAEIENSITYQTVKRFEISPDQVVLMRNLGEYR